jgi:hypothetical protein
MLGGTDRTLKAIHLVLPTAVAVAFAIAVAPAVPTARWVALDITPVGVIANLWLRTTGKPAVPGGLVGDFGYGPVPVDLAWSYVREIAPLAIILALQLAL